MCQVELTETERFHRYKAWYHCQGQRAFTSLSVSNGNISEPSRERETDKSDGNQTEGPNSVEQRLGFSFSVYLQSG